MDTKTCTIKFVGALFFALLLLVGTACENLAPAIPTPSATLQAYPLQVGNHWMYSTYNYSGFNTDELMWTANVFTDTVQSIDRGGTDTVITMRRDTSAELLLEGPPALQRDRELAPAQTFTYTLVASADEIFSSGAPGDGSEQIGRGELIYKIPLQVGAQWYLNQEAARLDPSTELGLPWHVLKTDSVQTPAGTFANCFQLEQWMGGTTIDKWFCPSIGLVSEKAVHDGTPSGTSETLIDFSVSR